MSSKKKFPFLYNIGVGTNFRGNKKKAFLADTFVSQFCEIQFEFTVIFNLSHAVFFSVTREMNLE